MEIAVVASGLRFPECPRWWGGELWFVDGPAIVRMRGDGALSVHAELGCPLLIGLTAIPGGNCLVGDAVGRRIWAVDPSGQTSLYVDLSGETRFMINEIMLMADGSLIVSDVGFDAIGGGAPTAARLIRVLPDKTIERSGSPMLFANGMVANKDRTGLFIAETGGARIWEYALSAGTGLDAGRAVAENCHGIDGLAVSGDATFWYANHESGEVVHLDGDGRELARIASGFGCATSCVLDDTESALYITALPCMPSFDEPLPRKGAIVRVIL